MDAAMQAFFTYVGELVSTILAGGWVVLASVGAAFVVHRIVMKVLYRVL